MGKVDTVVSLFNEGFNCAQALLATYGTGSGLNRDLAIKMASTFGGGMGRSGEICGAVTGALMIIGLTYGNTEHGPGKRAKAYKLSGEFLRRFSERNSAGSILCRKLIGFTLCPDKRLKERERDIIRERCPRYVRNAAEIIEELL